MRVRPILLVEDSPEDEFLLVRALAKSNLQNQIVVAHDGVEALDYLFQTGVYTGRPEGPPAVVLLDLKLRKISGLQVLQRIGQRESTKILPVVILISSDDDKKIIEGIEPVRHSYLRKPVGVANLMEAMQQLGLYWILTNEPLSQ